MDVATAIATPQRVERVERARRKSAKAAAVYVTANVKEDMLVPPAPITHKRSFSRGNSVGSTTSSASATHLHSSSSSTQVREIVLKNSKGHPKKKTALSSYAVEYLKAWMMSPDHIEHPYPTEDEKVKIMKDTSIELKQLTNWFVNNRKRYWKPKVEEMRQQSLTCNVSLQEMAAAAQAAGGGSVVAVARMASEKSSSRNSIHSAVVSSEGEESAASTKERHSVTKSSNKKRKKYSTLENQEEATIPALPAPATMNSHVTNTNTRSSKKSKEDHHNRTVSVVNPMVSPPIHGIATARTYESVKAARKMSRIVSEPSSNEESEESDGEENKCQNPMAAVAVKAVVSNPLAITLPTPHPVLTTMVSQSTMNTSTGTLTPTEAFTEALPTNDIPALDIPALVPLTADQVADLEYSMTTLDAELEEHAISMDAGNAVEADVSAATICCGGIMPHSCNLADPLSAKSRVAQPCALCSACRDWNLGEFCPWDLTGILGDISTEIPAPSSSSSLEDEQDDYFTAPSMDGSTEEATTVTKNSTVAEGMTSMKSKAMSSGPVPQEISHSTMTHSTSAADFMSSMADLENWD